ncbi:GerAB/ArcD/ProY family transporter [Anaerosalibacter sp. Marseille-P3206]|uniref:GerAB/ArcD/ProY family transporter n=1 Tax=Anaerosalibacter sp. Marseille-P3206 TaxID=1871005 RepID=UPI0009852F5F|nr:endospore germination permease [Anaerosalibacter sp. Marseille-P3206]
MNRKNNISLNQLESLIITSVIGVGILTVPSVAANILGNDGWLVILLGGLLAIPFIYIMNRLNRLYPGRIYYDFGKDIIGPYLFNVINFIYACFFLIIVAFTVRVFAEAIKIFLLNDTPTEVIIITMLFTSSYIARNSIESLARMAVLILPIIIIITLLFTILAIPAIDFTNILPLFKFNFGDLKNIFRGVGIVFFSYSGYEIMLIAMAYVGEGKKSVRYSIRAISYVIIIYLVMFFVTLAEFGVYELKREIWPSLSMMREIELPGFFIENVDGLILSAWVLVVFATIGPYLYSLSVILSKMFNTQKHNIFVLPAIPIIFVLSLIPQNLIEVYTYMEVISKYMGILVVAIFPTILYIIALIKRRREKCT